jgi:anti-sigma B factor antagonist
MRVLASSRAVIRPLEITGLWQLLDAERVEAGAGIQEEVAAG